MSTPIPDQSGPEKMLAASWSDLCPIAGDPSTKILYHYQTEPLWGLPHRFIILYDGIPHYCSSSGHIFWDHRDTFEIILYDPMYYPTPTGDGEIVVQYLSAINPGNLYPGHTVAVGIEDSSETVGIQYYYNRVYHPRAAVITDTFAIKYTTDPHGAFPRYSCNANREAAASGAHSREGAATTLPAWTMMSMPHPNPFARSMTINYQIARATNVNMQIYDAAGRVVRTLAQGRYSPGFYSEAWNGCDNTGRKVSAGVYFVRLETDDYQKVNKAVLLR
jgi:hypothetical protein